ncbi:O-antigen ligase domain-containing protein [Planctomycetota bacterium]|nr:O-antigen ligase domain-containing protein [Planctomycetota bacterium]
MAAMVPLTLALWVPTVVVMFAMMKPHKAAMWAFVLGWMYLPELGIGLPGLPDFTKVSSTAIAIMLGVCLFDMQRLASFRPSLWDVPIVLWCIAPFMSSVVNGDGVYDGLSSMLKVILPWGFPYLIGRLYLSNPIQAREMARIMFIATIIYLPLVWLELIISPQLHLKVYGQHAHQFIHSIRWGGYRPRVFMKNGLILGLWMAGAGICGVILWHTKQLKDVFGMPISWLVPIQLVTFVFCKSSGALVLGMAGIGLYFSTYYIKTRVVMLGVLMALPIYLSSRVIFDWDAQPILDTAGSVFSPQRVESLQVRIYNENELRDKAMERPLFGWGGYNRSRIQNEEGEDTSTTDSAWIIVLGQNGLLGLISFFGVLMLPMLRVAYRVPPKEWRHPVIGPSIALAMVLGIFMIDRLLNAQINPIPLMIAGGLTTMPWRKVFAMIQMQAIMNRAKKRGLGVQEHPSRSNTQ